MNELSVLADRFLKACARRHILAATAESCTGGMIISMLTDIAGSSSVVDRGFVTYSNEAKMEMLGVSAPTLDAYGAVSLQTAQEMAAGALARSHAGITLAVTGIAGPDGGSAEKPVGTVCFAWALRTGEIRTVTEHYSGSREEVRRQSVKTALSGLLQLTLNLDL
jgi:nicotinamide-nucleotide amidase